MKNFGNLLLACMAALLGACAGESAGKCDAVVRIDADSVVNRGYIGNGVQWDPYALDYGQGRVEISDADWAKLYARLDFMRPAFIRVMTNTTSVVRDGRLDRMRGFEHLSHILDYCQSHGVTVMFGDWGGSLMDARAGTVNRTLLDHAAAYVAWLVGEKGYDCIRYYNLVNEPNGFWSAADGDFDLWAKAVSYFRGRLDDAMHFKEAPDKLKIWGFWNIFGDEIFGAGEERVRPWYYAWSLLCRTLRPGSDFFAADVRGAAGVKAVAAVKDGRRTVAVVNVSREPRRVRIECPGWKRFRQATRYRYGEGLMRTEGDHTLLPDATGLRIDFRSGAEYDMPGESMILLTEQND